MQYKFVVFRNNKGEFRFRFKAPNGKNMFASEGYKNKPSAMKTIESIKKMRQVLRLMSRFEDKGLGL